MSRINLARFVLGGVVAGIVIDAFEFIFNGIALKQQVSELLASLNRPMVGMKQVLWLGVLCLVLGCAAVWTYAAIRPRFGQGPKTAVYAAIITWITAFLVPDGFLVATGILPLPLTMLALGVGLIETIAATLVGAWLYKE